MLAAYTGHEPRTFPDYVDGETGRTLSCEPGGVYDVVPVSGDVPGQWFTPVKAPAKGKTVTASASLAGSGDATARPELSECIWYIRL